MRSQHDRDRAIEQLLRQSSRAMSSPPTPDDCVDGESLAAWAAGVLPREQAVTVEHHVADCARCQTLLATFARTEAAPGSPAQQPHASGVGWHLRWLVPLATAATVVAIWVAMPDDQRSSHVAPQSETAQDQPKEAAPKPLSTPPAPQSTSASRAPVTRQTKSGMDSTLARNRRADKDANEGRTLDSVARADRVSEKPKQERARANEDKAAALKQIAAEPGKPGAREERFGALGWRSTPVEIGSPFPSHRWRIAGAGRIEYTVDGGLRWTSIALASPDVLTAGHSPAQTVAWLVGRSGAVYVTTDGSRFDRVPFTEPVDLVSVVAVDGRQATVTAADGRIFRTTDRGATWIR